MTFPSVPGTAMVPRRVQCAVCLAGDVVVNLVNRLIVGGATYAETYRSLEAINDARVAQEQPEISYQSVMRHGREHLPARSAAVREIVERRARAAQLDVEEGTANIITQAALAEAVMVKAFQNIDNLEPTISEGLQAAKFLEQLMRAERGNVGLETAFAELGYLIEAVKEAVPQQYWSAITAKIEEKRGSRVIDATEVPDDEFDPGDQVEEEFSPADDGDEEF